VLSWRKRDENPVLASVLTGNPLLLISNDGCGETHVVNKVAQALGRQFLVYDPRSKTCWATPPQNSPSTPSCSTW
jgi:hypothetical protein